MKRREFLASLGAACMLGLSAGMAGCISNSVSQVSAGTPTVSPTESPAVSQPGNTGGSSLAGTCPRGKSCRSPQCQLWSDLGGNGICDRGNRQE